MTMISRVGRRHPSVRLLIGFMYALLILGGCTMVYPFILMISGSTKSGVDIREVSWLPAFLVAQALAFLGSEANVQIDDVVDGPRRLFF